MSYVVDASVAIKWFVPEIQHDDAVRLLGKNGSFDAPDFILAEIANILWKKATRGEVTKAQAESIMAAMPRYLPSLHPLKSFSERALAIAIALDHPAYDCFYLACAEMTGGIVITADRRFQKAVEGTQFDGHVMGLEDTHDP